MKRNKERIKNMMDNPFMTFYMVRGRFVSKAEFQGRIHVVK